ncbi:MAG: endonuclease/exonuclease/phosphatase family protein [Bacteriovoracaceae bacterium]|nr:endonuclease/exonuclease/phosphatase family protein [Bacteriovoracaceae bacterium]
MLKLFILLLLSFSSLSFAQTRLKMLTYNVYAKPDFFNARLTEERMNNLCEKLKVSDWDVVFLQEVWTANHRERLSHCGFEYVMDLRKTGSVKKEKNLGSGLLILSRYPLEQQRRFRMVKPSGFQAVFKHGEAIVRKSIYLAKLNLGNNKSVWLANTHLVANYCDTLIRVDCVTYENVRALQLAKLSDVVLNETENGDVIFGGDLNMGPNPVARDVAWDQWQSYFPGFAQASYDENSTSTSSDRNSWNEYNVGKIDHLFVSYGLEAISGQVVLTEKFISEVSGLETNVSDHYGWEMVVEIP